MYATLSASEQATLQSMVAATEERLLALLDHLPFTPPPTPSDPAQWRPLINQALDQKQRLHMRYFSAGRNLLTERLVDPYWVEERHGVPYLLAYCHQAGRVLTFRLDRIQALTLSTV